MRFLTWLCLFSFYDGLLSLIDNKKLTEFEDCSTIELTEVPLKVSKKSSSWSRHLDIYTFDGFARKFSRLFLEVHLQVNITDQNIQIYQGENCSTVKELYNNDQRLFGLLRQFNLMRSKQLNPFDKTVIGIATNDPYLIRVRIWEINHIRVVGFFSAVILYLLAYSLVRNAIFFYTSGCTVGVLASLLIVGFVVYRFAPKKWFFGIPLLCGGWSLSFYFVYFIWKNFAKLILGYQKAVATYFATIILLSFAICYRYGPPTDVRSHNLAQWTLQLIALIVIYFSCQIEEISYIVILVLLSWSCTKKWLFYFTEKMFEFTKKVWKILFPETQRLLTLEEYERQGEEETRKAIDQLRAYCRSPQADAWKITSVVKNPKRFASFVDGSTEHLTEDEVRLYGVESSHLEDLSDDSGEDELVIEKRSQIPIENQNRSFQSHIPCRFRRPVDFRDNKRDFDAFQESSDEDSFYEWNTSTRSLPSRKHRNCLIDSKQDLVDNSDGSSYFNVEQVRQSGN